MTSFLQFLLIGLGLGSAYSLFAQGAVLVYRGSGIVNFAHGAIGMLGAYAAFSAFDDLPIVLSLLAGVTVAGVCGLAFQLLVLRWLQTSSGLTRLIATLGLLSLLQAALTLRYGNGSRFVDPYLPHDVFTWGQVRVQEQILYIFAITVAITGVLWWYLTYSRLGLALRATAENQRAVQTLGWSPERLSAITWTLGSALAALAGVLIAPLTGLSPTGYTLIVTLAALSAAVLAGFRSFVGTFLGGMLVGVGEAMVTLYKEEIEGFLHQDSIPGLHRTLPFLLIVAVLVFRGRSLPLRSHVFDRPPGLGSGRFRVLVAAGGAAAFLAGVQVLDDSWAQAAFISSAWAVVVLSVVVLTGFAGQLSLGQWTLAGIGALLSSMLVGRLGWPLEVAIPIGALLTVPAGLLFALPAMRTRGVNLAIVTLAMGFTVRELVFSNGTSVGRALGAGRRIREIEMFGVAVDSLRYPKRWAFVCLVGLVLAAVLVANLRRSAAGRRLVAVRANERAAASLGISVMAVKLYAFGVAAFIAALGGALVRFQYTFMTFEAYDTLRSIDAVGYAVIGGVGFVSGSLASMLVASGGLGTKLLDDVLGIGDWEGVITGGLLLAVVVVDHNGLVSLLTRRFRHRAPPRDASDRTESDREEADGDAPAYRSSAATLARVRPAALEVSDLTVRFGAVEAVSHLDLRVEPGEVVGLIGPNGAGKTTVIDAVTGFVKPYGGSITLGGRQLAALSPSRRAALGVRRSFQSLELFDDLDVAANVRCGCEQMPWWVWLTSLVHPRSGAGERGAQETLRAYGLESSARTLPTQLSHGRRRLVAMARAVASGPSVVLLDEPAAGLDTAESHELARHIRALADERGMGVLLVEHDVALVMQVCDRVVVIDFGAVIASGPPSDVRQDHAVREAYLGAHA